MIKLNLKRYIYLKLFTGKKTFIQIHIFMKQQTFVAICVFCGSWKSKMKSFQLTLNLWWKILRLLWNLKLLHVSTFQKEMKYLFSLQVHNMIQLLQVNLKKNFKSASCKPTIIKHTDASTTHPNNNLVNVITLLQKPLSTFTFDTSSPFCC